MADKWFYAEVKIFCLFNLILYVPVNNLSVMLGRVFLVWTSTKQRLMCLAQGHNTLTPVRLEPTALLPRVKHSTTEPLRSQKVKMLLVHYNGDNCIKNFRKSCFTAMRHSDCLSDDIPPQMIIFNRVIPNWTTTFSENTV